MPSMSYSPNLIALKLQLINRRNKWTPIARRDSTSCTDFVHDTNSWTPRQLRVDTTGSASFGGGTLIATIEGVTGLTDEAALVTAGRLLLVA